MPAAQQPSPMPSSPLTATQHPEADVPAALFAEDEWEQRWRKRFSAVRVSLPDWARDAPERAVYVSRDDEDEDEDLA